MPGATASFSALDLKKGQYMSPGPCRRALAYCIVMAIFSSIGKGQTPESASLTYQGQLKSSGSPVTGNYKMSFRLFNAGTGGVQVGPTLTFDGVGSNPPPIAVANGLFTVLLDFGAAPFDGGPRWLDIAINGTPLLPRQSLSRTPYATHARGILAVASVAELLQALSSLPSEGGRILLAPGMYQLSASIIVNHDNVTLEGAGAVTYLRLLDHVNQPCVILGDPNCSDPSLVTRKNIALRHMRIDGNKAGQDTETAPGSCLRNNCVTIRRCQDSAVEDVLVENARSGGIVTEKSCVNISLRRITSSSNYFDGIACYQTTRSNITGCTSRLNLDSGLSVDCDFDENAVTDCFFADNTKNGMFISNASMNLFSHCTIRQNADQGVFIRDGVDCPGASIENLFSQNYYYCNTNYGLWQAGSASVNNILDGGVFRGNDMGAINENPSAPLLQYHPTLLSGACP